MHESGVLGASPDGIVTKAPLMTVHCQSNDAHCFDPDIIEVKCPYSGRYMTVGEFAKTEHSYLGKTRAMLQFS